MNCLPGFKLKFGNPLSQFLGFIGEGLDGVLSFLLKGSGPRKGWQPSFLLNTLNIFAESCKQMGHPECTHINLGMELVSMVLSSTPAVLRPSLCSQSVLLQHCIELGEIPKVKFSG